MRHWKAWDEETQTVEYEIANGKVVFEQIT